MRRSYGGFREGRADRPARRWYYHFPGAVYAFGPTNGWYTSERKAREEIRKVWNLKRLPRGTELWRAYGIPRCSEGGPIGHIYREEEPLSAGWI
ncbi:MAG: hypothetical protein AB1512_02815 [Thermodesulfobacteriota bacterium]